MYKKKICRGVFAIVLVCCMFFGTFSATALEPEPSSEPQDTSSNTLTSVEETLESDLNKNLESDLTQYNTDTTEFPEESTEPSTEVSEIESTVEESKEPSVETTVDTTEDTKADTTETSDEGQNNGLNFATDSDQGGVQLFGASSSDPFTKEAFVYRGGSWVSLGNGSVQAPVEIENGDKIKYVISYLNNTGSDLRIGRDGNSYIKDSLPAGLTIDKTTLTRNDASDSSKYHLAVSGNTVTFKRNDGDALRKTLSANGRIEFEIEATVTSSTAWLDNVATSEFFTGGVGSGVRTLNSNHTYHTAARKMDYTIKYYIQTINADGTLSYQEVTAESKTLEEYEGRTVTVSSPYHPGTGYNLNSSNSKTSIVLSGTANEIFYYYDIAGYSNDLPFTKLAFVRPGGDASKEYLANGTEANPVEVRVGDEIRYVITIKNNTTSNDKLAFYNSSIIDTKYIEDEVPSGLEIKSTTASISPTNFNPPSTPFTKSGQTVRYYPHDGGSAYMKWLQSGDSVQIEIITEVTDSNTDFTNRAYIYGHAGFLSNYTAYSNYTFHSSKRVTADITVSKAVSSTATDEAQKEFDFDVVLTNSVGAPVSGTFSTTDGTTDSTITFGADGKATVTLKDGKSLKITKIPVGTRYTVTEKAASKAWYTATGEVLTATELTDDTIVAVTNTRKTQTLTVKKTVSSVLPSDNSIDFNFKVTLTDSKDVPVNGTFGGVVFSGGVATFTLKHNATKALSGIPAGYKYKIEETGVSTNFTVSNEVKTAKALTSNTTETITNTRQQTAFTVSKLVKGKYANLNKDFSVKLELLDESGAAVTETLTFGGVTFTNGTKTYSLSNEDSETISGLPRGYKIKVSEPGLDSTYTASYKVDNIETAAADGAVTAQLNAAANSVEVTNTKGDVVVTGIADTTVSGIALVASSLIFIGIALAFMIYKRREKA